MQALHHIFHQLFLPSTACKESWKVENMQRSGKAVKKGKADKYGRQQIKTNILGTVSPV
jgi:hypothetical protein